MLRVLSKIQQDAQDYSRQQKAKPGQSKAQMKGGRQQKPRVYTNPTMSHIMKQRTKGEDWSTARKKLLSEAKKRQAVAKPKYREGPRPRDIQRPRRKCKNCP
jgi:hypothetical protein